MKLKEYKADEIRELNEKNKTGEFFGVGKIAVIVFFLNV